ncbi:CCA tRNA nucleotidyltransferase [Roseomonas sp. HJA6]|uniref:CCA tRNA nucleotidyltransferase n=1 Tax=Roseomonas alba TaxID=2846776 RepID=A0ABS7AA21_9PROT|nr:CCA tRNA nucleotidyltransferase [Neoroseomonas alba]
MDAPAARITRPAFLDQPEVAAVLAVLPGARAVGGCVRDALAGRDAADVDVAAPFAPEDIADRLRAAGLKVFETGLAHGTVTAVLNHAPVEVTALRRDVLTDGRHAVVEWTDDWREDAARRDFTINAMSLGPDGALFDYFGGRTDLAAGLVRFVGDPDTRLAEDYLRALRFFRFQARYGRGAPDPAAVAAIRRAVPGLGRLSAERIWMELKRILSVPDPLASLALMAETGVLRAPAVLPEACLGTLFTRLIAMGGPPDPLLRLAALLCQGEGTMTVIGQIAGRLKLSGQERDLVEALADCTPADAAANRFGMATHLDQPGLRRLLASLHRQWRGLDPRVVLLGRSWLAAALPADRWRRSDQADDDPVAWARLRAAIASEPIPVFPIAGRDVIALGIPPGPAVGAALDDLRSWWMARGCCDDREACLAELRRRLANGDGGTALGG